MEAVFMCRDLVNRPVNDIISETLAKIAKKNLKKSWCRSWSFEKKQIEFQMDAFLSVAIQRPTPQIYNYETFTKQKMKTYCFSWQRLTL